MLDENLRRERVAEDDLLAHIRETHQPNGESLQAVVPQTTGELSAIRWQAQEKPPCRMALLSDLRAHRDVLQRTLIQSDVRT